MFEAEDFLLDLLLADYVKDALWCREGWFGEMDGLDTWDIEGFDIWGDGWLRDILKAERLRYEWSSEGQIVICPRVIDSSNLNFLTLHW